MLNRKYWINHIGFLKVSFPRLRHISFVLIAMLVVACSSGDPRDNIAEAKLLYQRGESQAAIIELKKALKGHPDNAEARFVLGEINLESGNGQAALKELTLAKKYGFLDQRLPLMLAKAYLINREYDRALESVVVSDSLPVKLKIEVLLLRASAFLGKGKNVKAEKLMLNAAALNEDNVDLLLAQAKYALSQGNYRKTESYLETLHSADLGNIDGDLLRGTLFLQQGKHEEAASQFQDVIVTQSGKRFGQQEFSARVGNIQSLMILGEVDKAEKAIQNFLSRSPKHPIPLYFEAVISYGKQEYSNVKDNLQQVLTAIPNHYPSLLLLGAANFSDENYEQANKYLSKFVDRVPTHIYARKLLGITRLRLDRSEEALAILKEGVSETESDAGLLALIGRVTMRTDIKSAVGYFEKASQQQPESTEIRKQLAKIYIANGDFNKAIETLNFVGGESVLQAEALEVYSHLEGKDYEKARALAEKLITKYAADPRFYLIRASVEISAGYKLAAERYLLKSVEVQSNFTPALIALAKLKIQSGLLGESKKWYERVVALQPNNLPASLGLAEISERQGFPDIAIGMLKKAVEQHPDHHVPQAVLAGYYLQNGKAEEARDLLTKVAEKHDHPGLWQMLGQSYEALDNWNAARSSYEKVLGHLPKSAVAHVSLARVFVTTEDANSAESHFETALQIEPGFKLAHVGLANLAISAGKFEKASAIGQKLLKAEPKSPLGHLVLADVAFEQKNYSVSKQHFINSFGLKPNRNVLQRAYANFQKVGQVSSSLDLLSAWLKTFPTDKTARLMLATKYQENGKYGVAEKEYRLLLKVNPDDPVILNNLALLRLSEDPAEAKQMATRAYENAKSNVAIMDTYGWVLVKTGDYQQGLTILERAASANPHPDIQYHLAFALTKTGQTQRAKSILSDLLAGPPKFAERASAEQLLSTLQ